MQNSTYYYYSRRQQSSPKAPKPQPKHRLRHSIAAFVALVAVASLFNITSSHNHTSAVAVKHFSKSQTVCLDPGHGGSDPGALSNDGTISERDINLIVAKQVEANLEKDGYQVFMTRTSNDQTLTNHDRYSYCNSLHATILVSIHHNFFQDSTVDYASALFYKDQDQALANTILASVANKLNIPNDNISQFDDGVLSESTMPAALSEGFFITSDYEYSQLTMAGSTRLNDEADAISQGIITYFTQPAAKQPVINPNPQQIERDD